MRAPLRPGFYWVRVVEGEPPAVAQWAPDPARYPSSGWLVPGYDVELFPERDSLQVLSERLEEPDCW